MKKQIIVIGIIVILLVVGFCGCNEKKDTLSSDEEIIVGIWKKSNVAYEWNITMTMHPNGTVATGSPDVGYGLGEWELKDGKLILTWMEGEKILTDSWYYSFNDYNTLLCTRDLEDVYNTTSVYERQYILN